MRENVDRLAGQVGLSETDKRVLEFVVLLQTQPLLSEASSFVGDLTNSRLIRVLSALLFVPQSAIAQSLHRQGVLVSSGLIAISPDTSALPSKLEAVTPEFVAQISSTASDPMDLLSDIVAPSLPAKLHIDAFEHIAPSLGVVLPLLRQALDGGKPGVNIFIYGRSGTGKSELARTLALAARASMYEVSSEDRKGVPVVGKVRLSSFKAAQCFLKKSRTILLFDEAEDVFGAGDDLFSLFQPPSAAHEGKAWINRLLESNPVPTIWLSNSATGLDPAFVRRFDVVFELPVPPRQRRAQIIHKLCADIVDPNLVSRLAESEVLAPAVVARAATVVRAIREELGSSSATSSLELLINNTLEAQGHAPVTGANAIPSGEPFDPVFASADADLLAIAEGMRRVRQGRICLYGPPGTGKTAFGRWLADRLEMPLETRRASDLMSKYVGESEKKLARAFRTACSQRSILMIDEVDTFLQDRRRGHHSWEVSLVNEMLTQIESFPGIFIGSTNLLEGLDQASLRRFDLKVRFGYLPEDRAWALLQRHCAALQLDPPTLEDRQRLAALITLAPGDFATIARQSAMHPIPSSAAFVARLDAECNLKQGPARKIGY